MIFAGDETPVVKQALAAPRALQIKFRADDEYLSDRARDAIRDDDSSSAGHVPLLRGMKAAAKRQQYGTSLSALYRGIELPPPSSALASDADAYEVLLRNPVVASSVDKRYSAAAGKLWRLIPQDKTKQDSQLTNVLTDALKQIQGFYASRYLVAKAIMLGSSFAFIQCERRFIKLGGIKAFWLVPVKLTEIDKRRIRWAFARDNKSKLLPVVRREIWSVRQQRWMPLPPEWPILDWVRCDEECRLGDGRGLWDAVYQPNYSSAVIEAMANLAIEAHGRGILDAAIDGLRRGSEDSTADRVQDWIESLQEVLAGGNILVHDKNDVFNVVTGGESAAPVILEYMRYYDDLKRSTILGAAAPFGGEGDAGQGSQAKTTIQKDVAEEISQADRLEIAGRIRWKLVDYVRRRNAPILREHGIDDDVVTPDYTVEAETKHDSQERMATAQAVKTLGLPLIAEEIYDASGFSEPRPGDPVVKGDAAPEQPAPDGAPGPAAGGVPEGDAAPEQPAPEFNAEQTERIATWAGGFGERSEEALNALVMAAAAGGDVDEAMATAEDFLNGGDGEESFAAENDNEAAPIGTRRRRADGVEYEKKGEGDWRPVPKGDKPAAEVDGAGKPAAPREKKSNGFEGIEVPDIGQYFDFVAGLKGLADKKAWASAFADVQNGAQAAAGVVGGWLKKTIADKLPDDYRDALISDTKKVVGFAVSMGKAAAWAAWAPVFGPGAAADAIAAKSKMGHDQVSRCAAIAAAFDWGAFVGPHVVEGFVAGALHASHVATGGNPIVHYLTTVAGSVGLIGVSLARKPSMMADAAAATYAAAGETAERFVNYLKGKRTIKKRKPAAAPVGEHQ